MVATYSVLNVASRDEAIFTPGAGKPPHPPPDLASIQFAQVCLIECLKIVISDDYFHDWLWVIAGLMISESLALTTTYFRAITTGEGTR